MPAEYEKLKAKIMASMHKSHPEAKDWSESRKAGYVYGTLSKMGWKRGKGGHMVKEG